MFSPTPNPRTEKRSWRDSIRRAVDLTVAFATLDEYRLSDGPHGLLDEPAAHPHREPLRAPRRAGRPGAVAPRAWHCTSPLPARSRRATAQEDSLRS